MTAYELLIRSIERKSQTAAEYRKKANAFLMFDQLTEEEYADVMNRIAEMEAAA